MFPVQSLEYMSALVALNSVFHLQVFVLYLIAHTVYKHPFLELRLIWGYMDQTTLFYCYSPDGGLKEREMG